MRKPKALAPPPPPTRASKGDNLDATTAYALSVTSGRVPSCRYVRLACERHLNDLKRTDEKVWFDPKAAERFFRYCEKYLQHYKGEERGKPLILEPWQKFTFGCIYGWKQIENGVRTNFWRFNINYIEVPRKNGKTTLCAGAASYDAGFVNETGAEVYCLATKEDQAKLLYNDVQAYIQMSDALDDTFEILKGRSTIFARDTARTSFIKPLGSDSKKQDGLNPLAAYCDELHEWPDRGLWDVMRNAFGARKHWHMIAITTAGHDRQGICYEQREHIINILEGRIQADNRFGIIFTLDKDMDYRDEKNWYIANPNLGCGKILKFMQDEMLGAEQMPSGLNTFLNKQLNIWTDVAEAWLATDTWNKCAIEMKEEDYRFKHCTAAFDLARVGDLSAVSYVFGKQNGIPFPRVFVDFYLPNWELRERSERDGVDYKLWADQGWIKLTPGKTTDYDFILADISRRAQIFKVDRIMYDRHFSGELIMNLTNEGFEVAPVGMGFISLGTPTAELERAVVEGTFGHNNNPVLNWNVGNTVISKDAAGNIKPDKLLSVKRIDGVVSTIMALSDVVANRPKISKYEKSDLVTFRMGGSKT